MLRCRGARRAPIYIGGALVLVAWPGWLWPARAASGLLLILGILHAVAALRPKPPVPLLPRQRHRLVTDANSDCGNERYYAKGSVEAYIDRCRCVKIIIGTCLGRNKCVSINLARVPALNLNRRLTRTTID